MPREDKIDRSYHEILRRLGVKNPGETLVGRPVQLVGIADDYTHLVPPILAPLFGVVGHQAAPGVGSVGGIELTAGPGGIWVLGGGHDGLVTVDNCLFGGAAPVLTVVATIDTAGGFRGGDVVSAGTAVVTEGTFVTANLPPGRWEIDSSSMFALPFAPFYLPPAWSIVACGRNDNQACDWFWMWQELPPRSPLAE